MRQNTFTEKAKTEHNEKPRKNKIGETEVREPQSVKFRTPNTREHQTTSPSFEVSCLSSLGPFCIPFLS